jgi:tyrosyl-tRNA synthetase
MSDPETAKFEDLLSRNVGDAINRGHILKNLASGKKLKIKFGVDPTSPDLHIGHAVPLQKLREFQDLGWTAVLVIGDFTAQIGDPSGRDKTRPPLTAKEVKLNMKNYLRQAGKIINLKKTEVVYNSKWLDKLKGVQITQLLEKVSIQQIIEREDFKNRLAEHKSVQMHELIYPIMQGYDSVVIEPAIELGGTDQTFNLLLARALMEKMGLPPQDIITVPLLEGTDGERKMSKSLGNYIGLEDIPEDMFGKTMSIPDKVVFKYFLLTTALSEGEIGKLVETLGPKALKERLAFEIVRRYHGEKAAKAAAEHFENIFSKRQLPDDIAELKVGSKSILPVDLIMLSGVIASRSEARRLVQNGGFDVDNKPHTNPAMPIELKGNEAIRVGKKRFFRVII